MLLALPVFPYCKIAIASKDSKRIYHARRYAQVKKSKKIKKLRSSNKETAVKQKLGTDYVPGQE